MKSLAVPTLSQLQQQIPRAPKTEISTTITNSKTSRERLITFAIIDAQLMTPLKLKSKSQHYGTEGFERALIIPRCINLWMTEKVGTPVCIARAEINFSRHPHSTFAAGNNFVSLSRNFSYISYVIHIHTTREIFQVMILFFFILNCSFCLIVTYVYESRADETYV